MLFPFSNKYCLEIFYRTFKPDASHLQISSNIRTFARPKLRNALARMNVPNLPDAS